MIACPPTRRQFALAAISLVAAVLVAGCGNPRTQPPSLVRPAKPGGFSDFHNRGRDVSLPLPKGWSADVGDPPRLITLSSGDAAITVWAYRQPAVPANRTEAELALKLLVKSLHRREPGFDLVHSRVTKVDGLPAVELEGRGKISKRKVRVRAVHLYKAAGEYVIDAYADPSQFARADKLVFGPIINGIHVRGHPSKAVAPGKQAKSAQAKKSAKKARGQTPAPSQTPTKP